MKKTTHKTILMFLIYALVLNPISIVLADQSSGLLPSATTKHCKMEGKVHENAMKMDEASSSMKMTDNSSCKCKKDCQHGACELQCADCGHFFVGLPAFTTEPIHQRSSRIDITPDLLHQQPMLMHYRPPKTLLS